ncbi:MAG: branched-chain amino acid ABC transporter permease [Candidatus Bathyarchaeia archaeon]
MITISPELILTSIVTGILVGGLYAILALGANLVVGVLRIVNLAHGAFVMLGMFVTYWLYQLYGVPPLLSLPISFCLSFVVGCLITLGIFKPLFGKEIALTVLASYGLQQAVINGAQVVWSGDYRKLPLSYGVFNYGPISVSGEYLVSFTLAVIFCVALYAFLKKTKLGKAMRAVNQDADAAATLGINVIRVRMINMGIGIGFAGIAGVVFSLVYYIYPYIGQMLGITALIVCVVGGLGDYLGTIIGALIIGISQSLSILFLPYGLKDAVGFIVFLIILSLKPAGLFGKG